MGGQSGQEEIFVRHDKKLSGHIVWFNILESPRKTHWGRGLDGGKITSEAVGDNHSLKDNKPGKVKLV